VNAVAQIVTLAAAAHNRSVEDVVGYRIEDVVDRARYRVEVDVRGATLFAEVDHEAVAEGAPGRVAGGSNREGNPGWLERVDAWGTSLPTDD